MSRRILLLALLASLAACGRKGALEPPEGGDPDAPRSYPRR